MSDATAALAIVVPLLQELEGFRATAYPDCGAFSYGYGHRGVAQDATISISDALDLLRKDAADVADLIQPRLPDFLNPNQFAALISFTYNVGPGKIRIKDGFLILKTGYPSTLLKKVQSLPVAATDDQLKDCADQFLRWVYASGQLDLPLCTRRQKERDLFLTPYSTTALAASGDPAQSPGAV